MNFQQIINFEYGKEFNMDCVKILVTVVDNDENDWVEEDYYVLRWINLIECVKGEYIKFKLHGATFCAGQEILNKNYYNKNVKQYNEEHTEKLPLATKDIEDTFAGYYAGGTTDLGQRVELAMMKFKRGKIYEVRT